MILAIRKQTFGVNGGNTGGLAGCCSFFRKYICGYVSKTAKGAEAPGQQSLLAHIPSKHPIKPLEP